MRINLNSADNAEEPTKHNKKSSTTIESRAELRRALEDVIDADMCKEVVNFGYSEDDEFDNVVFIESKVFFHDTLGDEEPKDIAEMFFNGEDLDSNGQADPTRDYFRFDEKGNVESTDKPETVYLENSLDDIIDYILDHLTDTQYNEAIQGLIDKYLESKER